jgi:hypothetical protein
MAATTPNDNWVERNDLGPWVEDDGTPSIVELFAQELGHDPRTMDHLFQVDTLAGGDVDVFVLGPADAWMQWTDVGTPLTEGQGVRIVGSFGGFRFEFNGTGAAGQVHAEAYRRGW